MIILVRRIREIIIELIDNGYIYFGTGGVLGSDTLAAQTILDLKSDYSQIKLILVLPCLSQTNGWNPYDIEIYESIKQIKWFTLPMNTPEDVRTNAIAIWLITVMFVLAT